MRIMEFDKTLLTYKAYSFLKHFKNYFIILYILISFFEIPYWCYNGDQIECDSNVQVIGLPFLNNKIYRIIELILLLFQAVFQTLRTKIRIKSKTQQIRNYILFIFLIASFIDVLIALIMNSFPYGNLILKGFIIVLISRSIREEWTKILIVLYKSKVVFFILAFNWVIFSIIGFILFSDQLEDKDFLTIGESLESMFILLVSCNFPDIMIKLFKQNEMKYLSIIFFISYIIISVFLIQGLLKALYYANYNEVNKIKSEEYKKKTNKIKDINLDESLNTSIAIVEYPKIEKVTSSFLPIKTEDEQAIPFFDKKIFEITMNIINLISISIFSFEDEAIYFQNYFFIIQILVSMIFIIEFVVFLYILGFKIIIQKKIYIIFFLINLALFFTHAIFIFFDLTIENQFLIILMKVLIVMRFLRVFILLNRVSELSHVFNVLKSIKFVLYSLLSCQFSFFYIYSSITMLIIGGKIKRDTFIGNEENIPLYYYHINFNDFGSSFMTCFALMMINNMNVTMAALSYVSTPYLKSYFVLFYFIAIMLILNICHTFILDIYVKIKRKEEKNFKKEFHNSVMRESNSCFESFQSKGFINSLDLGNKERKGSKEIKGIKDRDRTASKESKESRAFSDHPYQIK